MRMLKIVFGYFVTIAILFNTVGCASQQQVHRTMNYADLEWFVVDCRAKSQQIAMLQAMRPTQDEKLFARFDSKLRMLERFTHPASYEQRTQIGSHRIDWLINQHLMNLRKC